jgi:hypothetical protein
MIFCAFILISSRSVYVYNSICVQQIVGMLALKNFILNQDSEWTRYLCLPRNLHILTKNACSSVKATAQQ